MDAKKVIKARPLFINLYSRTLFDVKKSKITKIYGWAFLV